MEDVNALFFDLDGTLTDSADGIIQAYTYAFKAMAIRPPDEVTMLSFIGSPLRKNLAEYLPSSHIEEAVDHYFYSYDYLRGGLTDNRLYDGIYDMLIELKSSGIEFCVVSGKVVELIQPILNLFDIESFFSSIYGATRDGVNTSKKDLIASALAGSGFDPSRVIMVGDRCYDVEASRANGIRSVAVTWGYGDEHELVAANPDWIISDPSQLRQLVAKPSRLAL